MLSIPHLVIIFVIALIVLGPEKLPQVARVLGKVMSDFRRITTDFRVQIEDEMREMERHTRMQQAAQQTTPEPRPYTPSETALLGAAPAEASPPAAPAPATEPPSVQAPSTVSEKPADGESQPA
jgi:Tat protein translocase TatB subunit